MRILVIKMLVVLAISAPAYAITSTDKLLIQKDAIYYDPDSAVSSTSSTGADTVTDPSANVAIGRQQAQERGWSGSEFDCLYKLWTGESNWNHMADNPSSTAFGIPQALLRVHHQNIDANYPGYYTGPYKKPTGGDPSVQIRWGLDYIQGKYKTPCNALAMWESRSPHWY